MDTNSDDLTIAGALEADEADDLRRWVRRFLASPGSDNAALGAQLADEMKSWGGPVRLPFEKLHRLAGPPDQPTLTRLTDDDLETVEDMVESIEDDEWDPPPLVVSIREDQLVVEDGNHRTEGLRRAGYDDYWAVLCAPGADEVQDWLSLNPSVAA